MTRKRMSRFHKSKLPFVLLYNWISDTPAWQSLSANARSVYIDLKKRYNGLNNGQIVYSAREAGKALNRKHDTGNRALNELVEKGFLEVTEDSNFTRKTKQARQYLLTEEADNRPGLPRPARKTFLKWRPSNSDDSRKGAKHSRKDATVTTQKVAMTA